MQQLAAQIVQLALAQIGESGFQLIAALSEQLKGSLPTIEELETELSTLAATVTGEPLT